MQKQGPRPDRFEEPATHADDKREAPDFASLYRLMAWLSPAYPVGAFSYSSGLEWAIEAGDISDGDTLRRWLATILSDGAGFCDAVVFAHAYRACDGGDDKMLIAIAEYASALATSKERFLETTAQGRAFADVTLAVWPCPPLAQLARVCTGPVAYPVAVAAAVAGHRISLAQALPAYLQALAANWVSAAVRLVPLGQTDGQRIVASLESVIAATAAHALAASLDDAGTAVFRADIGAMRHEAQYTRLFRS